MWTLVQPVAPKAAGIDSSSAGQNSGKGRMDGRMDGGMDRFGAELETAVGPILRVPLQLCKPGPLAFTQWRLTGTPTSAVSNRES